MERPNILVIVSDQLTWNALPTYGNTYAKTPNIDRICRDSVRFDACYTPCPLCQPARAAFWTSRYPHELDVRANGPFWPVRRVGPETPTLGETFRDAGYDAVHFGKDHAAGALRGFREVEAVQIKWEQENPGLPLNEDSYYDRDTSIKVADYLAHRTDDRPFFAVADLINPHGICLWIDDSDAAKIAPCPPEDLPPLPENFRVDDMETRPKAVQYICCALNFQAKVAQWDEEHYRRYLYAYYYFLSSLDREIGRILDALECSGVADNTLIVFLADHGDGMAARGRVTKSLDFYDEVTRVPFIFQGAGVRPRKDTVKGIVSSLDLFPTLCGLAGIPKPQGLRGRDLTPVLRGAAPIEREYVASEWHTARGCTVSPGRMIRTDRYKYMRYLENGDRELYDMELDPKEKVNRIGDPAYAEIAAYMESLLQTHLAQTQDDFASLRVIVNPRYRSHTPGYANHRGLSAMEIEAAAFAAARRKKEDT